MLFWGVFPDRLKCSIIKPLHNNDDRCDLSKYRPVSLLPLFSKTFETLMQRRTLKHLTKYNILNKRQFILQINKFLINKPYYSLQEFFDQSIDP